MLMAIGCCYKQADAKANSNAQILFNVNGNAILSQLKQIWGTFILTYDLLAFCSRIHFGFFLTYVLVTGNYRF